MSAPTEAEIRAWILERWQAPRDGDRLSLAGEFSDAFGLITEATVGLWDVADFRPSEEERYDALLSATTVRVRRDAEQALLDAVIEALGRFARDCPAAPGH